MKTILYIDYARNKERYIKKLILLAITFALFFILTFVIELIVPKVNGYLNFPDIIKNLFALNYWQAHIYSNLWNMFAVIYPFVLCYEVMSGLTNSIISEERLETVIYMHNLGITRNTLFLTKTGLWIFYSLIINLVIFVENMLFFLILKNYNMIRVSGIYCIKLFAITIVYASIAAFISSFSNNEYDSAGVCLGLIIIPFIIARIHALIQLFADLLTVTGRQYAGIDKIYDIATRLEPLHILCPLFWCYPGQSISLVYVICAVAIILIMGITGYSIYTRDNIIYRTY